MKTIKCNAVTAAVFAGLLCSMPMAHAEDAESAYALSANVGLFSQYTFRGVSYTQEKPALQGGFDLAHRSGMYLGVWGTNVSDAALNNASGEIDIYGGYTNKIGDFSYDVGFLQFLFPGGEINGTNEKYNTLELYAGVTWSFLNVKYSRTMTDYFGFNDKSFGLGHGDSKGSDYIEVNLSHQFMPGWTVVAHFGRQSVKNYSDYDFTDWKLGLTKDFDRGWQIGLAWLNTNADRDLYTVCGHNGRCKDAGSSKWVAHVKRVF